MSKKKFLNRINEMTRKGIYPSLRILLEEDEKDPMGGDNPFSDDSDSSSEESSDDSDDSSSSDDPFGGGDDEGGDSGEGDSKESEGESPEAEDNSEKSMKFDMLTKQFKETNAALDARQTETDIEKELHASDMSLADYTLISENEDPQELFDKLNKTIEDNQETIDKFGEFSAEKINGVDINVDDLVVQAKNDIENFYSKEDPASIVAKRYLKKIRSTDHINDIDDDQEAFLSKLQKELDKDNIDNALPDKYNVNSVKNTSYNNAQGAKSQS